MPSARAESSAPAADHLLRDLSRCPVCWQYLKQISCVFSFFAIGLAVSPFCGLLWRCFGDDIPPAVGQRLIRGLFKGWLQVSSRIGIFDIRFPEAEKLRNLRATVLAPNHPSLIDAVILLSIVPNTVCIMRANLIESPFLGGAARLAGFVPTIRDPPHPPRHRKDSGRRKFANLSGGHSHGGSGYQFFKHGFALIAKKTGAPIQTIFIEREGRYLSKGIGAIIFCAASVPISTAPWGALSCRSGRKCPATLGKTGALLSRAS